MKQETKGDEINPAAKSHNVQHHALESQDLVGSRDASGCGWSIPTTQPEAIFFGVFLLSSSDGKGFTEVEIEQVTLVP